MKGKHICSDFHCILAKDKNWRSHGAIDLPSSLTLWSHNPFLCLHQPQVLIKPGCKSWSPRFREAKQLTLRHTASQPRKARKETGPQVPLWTKSQTRLRESSPVGQEPISGFSTFSALPLQAQAGGKSWADANPDDLWFRARGSN